MDTPGVSSFLRLLFVFMLSSSLRRVSSMDCNKDDRAALLKVKQQLGNPFELSTWVPATNCCTWTNLYCSETGRVYNVFLINAEISAPIAPAFGDLSALSTLQINNVSGLTGSIPPSFAKLTSLQLLDISDTSLSGLVPAFLSQCTNLSALILPNNKFSGPIPPALSKLPDLRYVDLSGNSLTGPVPPGLLHGTFQFLILSNNKLTGEIPPSYGQGDVDTIDLSHNKLTGDPSTYLFGTAKPMNKIDLSWNALEFDLSRVMFPHRLTYLDLSHNRIYGSVPKSLKDLYKLRDLNLTFNQLCGEIPTGRAMAFHGAECYLHNKCLCGTPLPPCRRALRK